MLRWTESHSGSGLVLAAALTLVGCVAGPSFKTPASSPDAAYTLVPLTSLAEARQLAPGEPMPEQWWTLLRSPRLDAVIQQALTDNQDLAGAQARLSEAQELAGIAASERFPRIQLDASAGRRKNGAATVGDQQLPTFSYFSVGPSISYLFDFAGGVRRGVEQQRALAEYQAHQLEAAQLSLSGNVTLQALAAASARAQIRTVEALLTDDDTDLQLVQTALDAGSASRVDVLTAQSQRASDEALLPPLRRDLGIASHALALLVGRTPAEWSPPEFELAEFSLAQQMPLSLPSELAHRRPDIRAAEAQLHAATAAVGVSTANLYPQITLQASASLQSTTLNHLFESDSGAGGLSGNLTAPIFNHGALRARQRAAEAAMRGARAHYQQVVLQSFTQVADALESLEYDLQLLDALQKAQTTAAENLALTRESYVNGNATVLQVLTAERLNQQAQIGLVRAQAQRFADAAQLLVALGG
jgi:NodT family efflux transporter outer membrane factor (OMF) lipoprotein